MSSNNSQGSAKGVREGTQSGGECGIVTVRSGREDSENRLQENGVIY